MPFYLKTVPVEARQFDGTIESIGSWFYDGPFTYDPAEQKLYIHTLEGELGAIKGTYIIKGVKGEFHPCAEDIFNLSYERIDLDILKL